ncbi:MAG: Peptidase family M50 [Syntrophorhabdus sp. PtaB.Bin047]|jgi:Zn-dependent protease|nr:MAG: Peptidase family M50 [Syntrophorhabdus sp. PtaB.Bin047]
MGLIQLLFRDPLTFLLLVIPLLYSIIIHELAHGWVADRMGDPTAKWLGRLTLNPMKHLDPFGTIALLIFGFGWAKPVPVNFLNLRDLRKGMIFVSAAGITANTILAFIAFLLMRLTQDYDLGSLHTMLYFTARVNIMLAAFNLIPIPPLDGSKILMGFLPGELRYQLERLEPFGMFIILGLLYLGVLNPVISLFQSIIISIIRLFIP